MDDDHIVRAMGKRRMTDAAYDRKVDSLNESRCLAFQKVLNYNTGRHNSKMHAVESPPKPLRLFINSSAGTGKSHVISVVHEQFECTQIGNGCDCMLMAPTKTDAFNIGGPTIHKLLNLPVEQGRSTTYRKLASARLHGMILLWKTNSYSRKAIILLLHTCGVIYSELVKLTINDDKQHLLSSAG